MTDHPVTDDPVIDDPVIDDPDFDVVLLGTDIGIYAGSHPRAQAPLILGHEFIGEVIEDHAGFTKGQRVTAFPLISCGACHPCRTGSPHVCANLRLLGIDCDGGMAEEMTVAPELLVPVPDGVPDELAALIEPVAVCLRVADRGPARVAPRGAGAWPVTPTPEDERRLGPALAAALPMALWVFACVTVAMIVLTERIGEQYSGPLLPAVAAVLSLGTGVLVQLGMRRSGGWRAFGVVGAGMAMMGFLIAGVAGAQMALATFVGCSVILGCAYGLCLGQGLRDVDRLAPLPSRGVATGLFYVVSYSGFALPFVLNTYEGSLGASAPMYVLAALAAITAVTRLRLVRQRGTP